MKKYYADKSSIIILNVILTILLIIIYIFLRVMLSFIPIIMYILMGVFTTVYLLILFFWLPKFFRSISYSFSEKDILCCSGFFIRRRTVMKFSSVKYYSVITTPFSEKTGINFVILNALGGNIILNFVGRNDLAEITRYLSIKIREGGATCNENTR